MRDRDTCFSLLRRPPLSFRHALVDVVATERGLKIARRGSPAPRWRSSRGRGAFLTSSAAECACTIPRLSASVCSSICGQPCFAGRLQSSQGRLCRGPLECSALHCKFCYAQINSSTKQQGSRLLGLYGRAWTAYMESLTQGVDKRCPATPVQEWEGGKHLEGGE